MMIHLTEAAKKPEYFYIGSTIIFMSITSEKNSKKE